MNNTNSIDELNKVLKVLLKHIRLIIFATIICGLISLVAVFFVIKPKYQSTTEIIVNQKLDKDVQAAEQQQVQATDLQLVNTYKNILNSQTVGNAVKNSIGKKEYNKTELTVDTDTTSQVISLNVVADSPTLAARTANKTADIFKRKINKIMNVNNVSVISKAEANNKPVSPKKGLSLLVGLVLGIIIGSFAALIKDANDKKVNDSDFIINELGLLDLGEVSDIDIKNIRKQIKNKK